MYYIDFSMKEHTEFGVLKEEQKTKNIPEK